MRAEAAHRAREGHNGKESGVPALRSDDRIVQVPGEERRHNGSVQPAQLPERQTWVGPAQHAEEHSVQGRSVPSHRPRWMNQHLQP